MDLSSRKLLVLGCCLLEAAASVNGRQIAVDGWLASPWALAEGARALYVGSSEHFALVSVVRRDQNASHLTVFEHASASLLAR
jgi:hypothetical protein